MNEYGAAYTRKQKEELKKLTNDQAILQAVGDARIDLEGRKPEEVYKLVLDRINKSEHIID